MTESNDFERRFSSLYGSAVGVRRFFCPGRVNIIGEHIDYNGGYVFPAAITAGISALIRPRTDRLLNLQSLQEPKSVSINLDTDLTYNREHGWANYPKGMLAILRQRGATLSGGDVLFDSNLPVGAGLSSSAAIEVLTGYMQLSLNQHADIDLVKLALDAQRAEREFVGVNCGIMDQYAVALAKKNCAILLDCSSLKSKFVPFQLQDCSLVVMNTKKARALAGSKYNERRAECEQAVEILSRHRKINTLCEATLNEVEAQIREPVLLKRARHAVSENQRVLAAVDALEKGDLATLGKLLTASHQSLKDDYEVTGEELDTMVASALAHPACLGARMTGAGFGGCAIALVSSVAVDDFSQKVASAYTERIGTSPEFLSSSAGSGVHEQSRES